MTPHIGRYLAAVALPLTMVLSCGAPGAPSGQRHAERAQRGPAAPRPDIVPRAGWHAARPAGDHAARAQDEVRAAFLHHTNDEPDYDCADAPRMLRSLQRDHIHDNGWDDVGYNFVVDRCGRVYEGREGSLAGPATGAHTRGFNRHTVGIAALGNFDSGPVPEPMLRAIAAVAAWRLSPGADPRGTVKLRSTNSESRFRKGTWARLPVIAGHRDAYETDCPGKALYARLPWLRAQTERLRAASDQHHTARQNAARQPASRQHEARQPASRQSAGPQRRTV